MLYIHAEFHRLRKRFHGLVIQTRFCLLNAIMATIDVFISFLGQLKSTFDLENPLINVEVHYSRPCRQNPKSAACCIDYE